MEKIRESIRIDGKEAELHQEHPVRFVCMEHLDTQIDEYVDEFEVAPDTYRAESIEGKQLDKRCRECGAPAEVALLHEKGM
ncbi:CxxH/CxxC protein [Brevibacillus composti]|uniref:CxxH/CxxC protein n=1 Tax=Brevibacillus composti TaxID=2796470 RepID=A0A7T5EKR4_9BACL|nr:CxxH/CxxC protein [Brevibacillus composti]QQE74422.1 CxxH/CxxC protein [Brevibacillus composti]QUO41504.1 CxxH/CxxC protein [Brevibacillus composti]